jgi:hypothetical protein
MACGGRTLVLVVIEWPQARPASGHAMLGHGLTPARRIGAGWNGGSGDKNYLLRILNLLIF